MRKNDDGVGSADVFVLSPLCFKLPRLLPSSFYFISSIFYSLRRSFFSLFCSLRSPSLVFRSNSSHSKPPLPVLFFPLSYVLVLGTIFIGHRGAGGRPCRCEWRAGVSLPRHWVRSSTGVALQGTPSLFSSNEGAWGFGFW